MAKRTLRPPNKMDYPNRIAELSIEQDWSQADLARRMDKPPQEVGRFWNGIRKLDQEWMELFAKALNCPDWMITCTLPKREIKAIKTFLDLKEHQKDEMILYLEFIKSKSYYPSISEFTEELPKTFEKNLTQAQKSTQKSKSKVK